MTYRQLKTAVQGFEKGKTVIDILFLEGKKRDGVIFDGLKGRQLHYFLGQPGELVSHGVTHSQFLADVRRSEPASENPR